MRSFWVPLNWNDYIPVPPQRHPNCLSQTKLQEISRLGKPQTPELVFTTESKRAHRGAKRAFLHFFSQSSVLSVVIILVQFTELGNTLVHPVG